MSVIAQTKRLTLRHFTLDDLERVHAIMSNRQVMKYSMSGPLSKQQSATFLQNILDTYQSKGYSLWAVESIEHQQLVGFCGHFFHRFQGEDEVELAYRLHPDFWGVGIASEAAQAASEYAFRELGLTRLISFISQKNAASIKVAENSGFELEQETEMFETPVLVYSLKKG
ncbi:GNAT family N-acetyltransferase [Motilimonas pumila]|uniref:N-acetyltransferase n=1 Tax=Motilimonas pumila TaxID=2303987 RepID=A0A418YFA7_9GAMM|nr:GNAT family N-acetyltransferase [Motilimonas pumila]RJG47886.1 N-acetyltransferase [Motilimonas pumila]